MTGGDREVDGIHWTTARAAEIPAGDDWLGPRERAVLLGLREGPRRESWRLGRFTAKRLLGADVEILAEPAGRPRAWRGAMPLPGGVSISHRGELGLAATVAFGEVGCDVEMIEPRSAAFVADYFTAAERAFVARAVDPALAANLLWSAKESALKVMGVGLTRDTRELEVAVAAERLVVRDGVRELHGAWFHDRAWIVTLLRERIVPVHFCTGHSPRGA